MASELNGVRVAFLVSNEGIEQAELTAPWQTLVTSRKPDDLAAFCATLTRVFARQSASA